MLGHSPLSDQPVSSVPAPLVTASADLVPMLVLMGNSQVQCFGTGTAYMVSPNNGMMI